jgi:hypothetical protein
VLKVEMHFSRQVLRPGSSLFIKGKAFYSFSAGPEGLRASRTVSNPIG